VYVPRLNFKKTMISGACTNNASKTKLSTNKEHITFPWIWGLTGYHFCTEKELNKIYLRLFFTFARITYYLEYIWFTHNIFCILQHDWRCNMDYSPLWSAFKMKTKYIRITSIQIYQRRHDTLVSCAKFNLLLNRKSASISVSDEGDIIEFSVFY
jgi:hypothetical protein